MGNILALAVTKILRLSVVIFTSLDYIPVVPVVPVDPVISSRCLVIGFTASNGVYHAVEKISTIANAVVPQTNVGVTEKMRDACSCGRGAAKKDSNRTFCKQTVGGVPSRCGCYKLMSGCSERCRCVSCENPYGTSRNAKSCYTITRTRQPSKLKGQKSKSGAEFLLDLGVSPVLGWTNFENAMFDCLVDSMISANIDLNASNCLEMFNKLRAVAEQQGINNIGEKSLRQLQGKLRQVRKTASIYEAFYKSQIERNWFS